jgi:hypothetical protein
MTYSRRDDNEKIIVAYWQDAGYICIPMDRYAGFDMVLIDPVRGRVFLVEVKNWQTRWKLTPAEAKLRENIGKLYHIVTNLDDAAKLILEAE